MAGTEYIMTSVMTLYHYILHTRLTINDQPISGPSSRSRLQFVIPQKWEREHHRKEKMMMMRWLLLWSFHDEMISDIPVMSLVTPVTWPRHNIWLREADHWLPPPGDLEITASPGLSLSLVISFLDHKSGFWLSPRLPGQEGKWIRLWLICGIYMSYEPG